MNYYDKKKKPSKIAIAIISVLLIVAGYFAVTMTAQMITEPKKETLVVGTNTPFPPFELRQGSQVVGFDIDLAEKIAKRTGRKLVVKDFSDFYAIIPSVANNNRDMAISAITITEDRKELVNFSTPYYTTSQAVLALKGKYDSAAVFTPESFAGLAVGYQEGTTSQAWAEKNLAGKGIILKSQTVFADLNLGIQLLRTGIVDAIIVDRPVAEVFVKENQDLFIAGSIETRESYGIAVPKGDPQKILPVANEIIKEMKESGEYDQLVQKWFGSGEVKK